MHMRLFAGALMATVLSLGMAPQAEATQFANYTAGFNYNTNPTYALGAASNTVTVSGSLSMNGVTGAFTGVTTGSAAGTMTFSNTVGLTLAESVTGLLTFVDPNSSTPINFDVLSVETVALTKDPNNGDQFQLYVLGNTSGGGAQGTAALSSLVFSVYGLSGSALSATSSLSDPPVSDPNPPAGPGESVPEPATALMLGAGLIALGIVRRRRA